MISKDKITLGPGGPSIYWAGEISEFWPPADLEMPRVTITRWTEEP